MLDKSHLDFDEPILEPFGHDAEQHDPSIKEPFRIFLRIFEGSNYRQGMNLQQNGGLPLVFQYLGRMINGNKYELEI